MFPALALAGALSERGWTPHLVTDRRGMRVALDAGGYEVHVLPSAGIAGKSLVARAAAVPVLIAGTVFAFAALRRLSPAVMVGFGSYASLPAAFAARALRTPVLVHEANAVLGRANRLLARKARFLATAFRKVSRTPPECVAVHVGMPVRAGIEALGGKEYGPPQTDAPVRLVITGGSQGSRAVGRIIPAALKRLSPSMRSRLCVTQQVRPEEVDLVRKTYGEAEIQADVVPFIEDMAVALEGAHIAIGRAGAATVAECAVAGRPAIYVPLPDSIDNHQEANALAAEGAGAGWMVSEDENAPERLAVLLSGLLGMPDLLGAAAHKGNNLNPPGAADRLAELAIRISRRDAP